MGSTLNSYERYEMLAFSWPMAWVMADGDTGTRHRGEPGPFCGCCRSGLTAPALPEPSACCSRMDSSLALKKVRVSELNCADWLVNAAFQSGFPRVVKAGEQKRNVLNCCVV